ncbi:MAG: ABC transporter substrate-binding protein [Promethearchaeota archaeon]|nr:MAG: ABC transporter substrate-binding protein [Candidatus Lokiarchaeota archaeon]
MTKIISKKLITILMIFLLSVNYYAFMLNLPHKANNFLTKQPYSDIKTNELSASTLKVGVASGPVDLDPVNSLDSISNDVIEQVAEGLFSYNYSDQHLHRINKLATDYWWKNTTTLHIKLREGVFFHDGTPFNASTAKWNFDRLNYLINATGTLPETIPEASTRSLWLLPNGNPIINNVETIGDYNITIHLNGVFSPFLDLLCYTNAYMLSPISTPAQDYLNTTTDVLVGTGPFVYDSYTPGIEVQFSRWDYYWRAPANFDLLIFDIIADATARSNAFLNGELDYIQGALISLYPAFEADPEIILYKFTEDTGLTSLIYQYIGFNNKLINSTLRKAMAYAFNYTFMLEEMVLGQGVRAYSPISTGWCPDWYNASVDFPIYNLTNARRILVDSGIAPAWLPINDDPNQIDWENTELATFEFFGNIGNSFREDMLVVLQDWFNDIGIEVTNGLVNWEEYLNVLSDPSRYDELELFFLGWNPDYFNPWNMLNPLSNPTSEWNYAQVNDIYLTQRLNDIVEELNQTKQQEIVKDLQYYLAQYQFHLYAYHRKLTFVHAADIAGVAYNAMERFYVYPIYRLTPEPFSLFNNADYPDDDGSFDLNWTLSDRVDNYSIYQYSSYITEINESLILLESEITDLSVALSDFEDGAHYFIVVAHNEYGDTFSNCIEVVVEKIPGNFTLSSTAENPDDDGNFVLTWSESSDAKSYSVYLYSNYITEFNLSLTLLADKIIVLSMALSGYPEGTYYFIVIAHNDYGDTLSNCVEVTVGSLPGDFVLSSTAEDPDDDGTFNLTWTASSEANSYSIYQYSSYISEINESITLLADKVNVLSMALSDYQEGSYYFIVIAHNEYDDTPSNCIEIAVSTKEIPPDIIGYNFVLIIALLSLFVVILVKKSNYKISKI